MGVMVTPETKLLRWLRKVWGKRTCVPKCSLLSAKECVLKIGTYMIETLLTQTSLLLPGKIKQRYLGEQRNDNLNNKKTEI